MFERIISFVGEENYQKLKNKTVLIVGLGGVGGYATEAIVRSGIENVIIMDYDKIDKSNINRQIIANNNNIGKFKVDIMKERINLINPGCQVISLQMFLDDKNISILDKYNIDYIIDACDTVAAKKLLIDYSLEKNIKLIASMGTAKKTDPTKLEIIDIRKTSYDPLAKVMRKYVLDKKINNKIMVVSSKEAPIETKILASLIFVPATAGLLCAKYVISSILEE